MKTPNLEPPKSARASCRGLRTCSFHYGIAGHAEVVELTPPAPAPSNTNAANPKPPPGTKLNSAPSPLPRGRAQRFHARRLALLRRTPPRCRHLRPTTPPTRTAALYRCKTFVPPRRTSDNLAVYTKAHMKLPPDSRSRQAHQDQQFSEELEDPSALPVTAQPDARAFRSLRQCQRTTSTSCRRPSQQARGLKRDLLGP